MIEGGPVPHRRISDHNLSRARSTESQTTVNPLSTYAGSVRAPYVRVYLHVAFAYPQPYLCRRLSRGFPDRADHDRSARGPDIRSRWAGCLTGTVVHEKSESHRHVSMPKTLCACYTRRPDNSVCSKRAVLKPIRTQPTERTNA